VGTGNGAGIIGSGMGAYRQTSLRPLAPAAIVVFAIALLIVVATSLGGDDGSSPSRSRPQTSKRAHRTGGARAANATQRFASRRFYVVKRGDNLAGIAQMTGVELEELRALNPSLDPQGLVVGQRVKLRQPGG
jgi:LysM domain